MKVGYETNVPGYAIRAEDGAQNAVRLSYASMAERIRLPLLTAEHAGTGSFEHH
jgi:hypothetical protein